MEYVRKNQVKCGRYDAMQKASDFFHEKNDCAVKALAVACGVNYATALCALANCGRKTRGVTYFHQIDTAVASLGFNAFDDFGYIKDRLKKLAAKNYHVKKLTTRQLTMFPDIIGQGTWLVYTNSHVLAVEGGQVHCFAAKSALHINMAKKIVRKDAK